MLKGLGIPVVVSNAGSLPEIVSGKHLLFESKNVDDLANKVIDIAKGNWEETPLKRFEWKDSIAKYLLTYGELVS